MHASRRILQSASSSSFGSLQTGGQPRRILPPQTFWQTVYAAYQGAYTLMTDDTARAVFEETCKSRIIQEDVLQHSTIGSIMTFSLFHNLQEPLLKKHIDAQEFVSAVGPALENFHDTLGIMRNTLPGMIQQEDADRISIAEKNAVDKEETAAEKPTTSKEEAVKEEFFSQEDWAEAILGVNHWKKQAADEPDSPAANLSKMCTDTCLDDFYYTSKVDTITRSFQTVEYVPGSVDIHRVALMNARAMAIYPEHEFGENGEDEHEEFHATELETEEDPKVAAQMDVLYEVTHTYKQSTEPMETVVPLESGNGEQQQPAAAAIQKEEDSALETVSYTNLVVAVMEGWLHKGPDKELHWKVVALRDALEFPTGAPSHGVKRHEESSSSS